MCLFPTNMKVSHQSLCEYHVDISQKFYKLLNFQRLLGDYKLQISYISIFQIFFKLKNIDESSASDKTFTSYKAFTEYKTFTEYRMFT